MHDGLRCVSREPPGVSARHIRVLTHSRPRDRSHCCRPPAVNVALFPTSPAFPCSASWIAAVLSLSLPVSLPLPMPRRRPGSQHSRGSRGTHDLVAPCSPVGAPPICRGCPATTVGAAAPFRSPRRSFISTVRSFGTPVRVARRTNARAYPSLVRPSWAPCVAPLPGAHESTRALTYYDDHHHQRHPAHNYANGRRRGENRARAHYRHTFRHHHSFSLLLSSSLSPPPRALFLSFSFPFFLSLSFSLSSSLYRPLFSFLSLLPPIYTHISLPLSPPFLGPSFSLIGAASRLV